MGFKAENGMRAPKGNEFRQRKGGTELNPDPPT